MVFLPAHDLIPKDGSEEPVQVPFRYNISGLETGSTSVYRPNPCESDIDALRPQVLGSVLAGNFHRVVKTKKASLVWEVPWLRELQLTCFLETMFEIQFV